jgi:hypothetical protein
VFMQLAAVKWMNNQTHDERSISGDEQWRSGYEQLSWQARYSTVTTNLLTDTAWLKVVDAHGY